MSALEKSFVFEWAKDLTLEKRLAVIYLAHTVHKLDQRIFPDLGFTCLILGYVVAFIMSLQPGKRLVRPLINAGIKNGEDLLKHDFGGAPNSAGVACAIINRLDLLHHHKSGEFWVIMYGYMERKSPIFGGERADDSKT